MHCHCSNVQIAGMKLHERVIFFLPSIRNRMTENIERHSLNYFVYLAKYLLSFSDKRELFITQRSISYICNLLHCYSPKSNTTHCMLP